MAALELDKDTVTAEWRLRFRESLFGSGRSVFELSMLAVLVFTIGISAAYDPADIDCTQQRCKLLFILDFAVTIVFCLEQAVHLIAFGRGKLLNPVRVVDLLLVGINLTLGIAFLAGAERARFSLNVIRCARLLRPAFTTTRFRSVRLLVVSVARCVVQLADVILLLFLFLLWFSAAATYQYRGVLRNRCVNNDFFVGNGSNVDRLASAVGRNVSMSDFVCGGTWDVFGASSAARVECALTQTCSMRSPQAFFGGIICPYGYTCIEVQNPYTGFVGFDNLLQSMLTLFTTITLELYYELIFWIADATDGFGIFFLVVFVVGGAYLLISLTVIVVTVEFEKSKEAEQQRLRELIRAGGSGEGKGGAGGNSSSFADVVRLLVIKQKSERLMGRELVVVHSDSNDDSDAERSSEEAADDVPKQQSDSPAEATAGQQPARRLPTIDECEADAEETQQTAQHDGTATEPKAAAAAQTPREDSSGTAAAVGDGHDPSLMGVLIPTADGGGDGDAENTDADGNFKLPPVPVVIPWPKRLRRRIRSIVETTAFELVITAVVIINLALLASVFYGMDDDVEEAFWICNILFTIMYTFEAAMRITAMGFRRYIKYLLNCLDLLIVVLSWLEIMIPSFDFPAIRALRTLRAAKMLKQFPSLFEWIKLIIAATRVSPMIVALLTMAVFLFSCLAMQVFGGRFCGVEPGAPPSSSCPQGMPRAHFDSFGDAMSTSLLIILADNWNVVMYDAMNARGEWVAVFFVAYFYVANYILLSILVAVLLSANQVRNDEDELEKEEAEAAGETTEEKEAAAEEKTAGAAAATAPGEWEVVEPTTADGTSTWQVDAAADAMTKDGGNEHEEVDIDEAFGNRDRSVQREAPRTDWIDPFVASLTSRHWLLVAFDTNRIKVQHFLEHLGTRIGIACVIFVGSVAMGLEDPIAAPDLTLPRALYVIDIIITVVYLIEMLLYAYAYGFIRGYTSYLRRDRWNVLDFVLVVISVMGVVLQDVTDTTPVRILKPMRALRVLRLVRHSPGMKLVMSAVVSSAPHLRNVVVISLLVMLSYSIAGVAFFAGSLRRCLVGDEYVASAADVEQCELLNGTMVNDGPNFDNTGAAMMSLFQVMTLEMWQEVQYRVTDTVGAGLAPQRDTSPWAALFVISFAIVGGVFLVNLFASALIDAYNREKRAKALQRSLFVQKSQDGWKLTTKRLRRCAPLLTHAADPLEETLRSGDSPPQGSTFDGEGRRSSSLQPADEDGAEHGDGTTAMLASASTLPRAAEPRDEDDDTDDLSDSDERGDGGKRRARDDDGDSDDEVDHDVDDNNGASADGGEQASRSPGMSPRDDSPPQGGASRHAEDTDAGDGVEMNDLQQPLISSPASDAAVQRTPMSHERARRRSSAGRPMSQFIMYRRRWRVVRSRVRPYIRSPWVLRSMLIAATLHFIFLCTFFYPSPSGFSVAVFAINSMLTFVYVFEVLIKLAFETPPVYFASRWNRVDAFVAFVCLVGFALEEAEQVRATTLFLTFRVVRVARLGRGKFALEALITKFGAAVRSLGHVLALVVVVFYLFAVMGIKIFGRVKWGPFNEGIDANSNFSTLPAAYLLLLRITTGGNWPMVMEGLSVQPPFCDPNIDECGPPSPVPELFFVVFIVVSVFVLRHLLIAVLLDSFASSGINRAIEKADAAEFFELWKPYDELSTCTIAPFDVLKFVRKLPATNVLSFNKFPNRRRVHYELRFLYQLKIKDTFTRIPLGNVVDALCAMEYRVMPPSRRAYEPDFEHTDGEADAETAARSAALIMIDAAVAARLRRLRAKRSNASTTSGGDNASNRAMVTIDDIECDEASTGGEKDGPTEGNAPGADESNANGDSDDDDAEDLPGVPVSAAFVAKTQHQQQQTPNATAVTSGEHSTKPRTETDPHSDSPEPEDLPGVPIAATFAATQPQRTSASAVRVESDDDEDLPPPPRRSVPDGRAAPEHAAADEDITIPPRGIIIPPPSQPAARQPPTRPGVRRLPGSSDDDDDLPPPPPPRREPQPPPPSAKPAPPPAPSTPPPPPPEVDDEAPGATRAPNAGASAAQSQAEPTPQQRPRGRSTINPDFLARIKAFDV